MVESTTSGKKRKSNSKKSKKSKKSRTKQAAHAVSSGNNGKSKQLDGQATQRHGRFRASQLPESDQWGQWVQHLQTRSTPAGLMELLKHAQTHPLMWVRPDGYDALAEPRLLDVLTRVHKGKRFAPARMTSLMELWLAACGKQGAGADPPDGRLGLETLAWAHALPRISPMISEPQWRALAHQLTSSAADAAAIDPADRPVAFQLLAAELPLTLAYLFPELTSFRQMWKTGRAALSRGVDELTDGEGVIHGRHLEHALLLLASWTRCSILASEFGKRCFDSSAQNQFEWAVRQALRLGRGDGSLVLSQSGSGAYSEELLSLALEEGGDANDTKIAAVILPGAVKKLSDREAGKLPAPSLYSEWSELAVMRSKWSRKSPQFTCRFHDRRLQSELSAAGRVIWSGPSDPVLNVAGQQLAIEREWIETCWFTDHDVDYLEIEAQLTGDWVIQRQMLLARRDQFLLLADAVIGPETADINYINRLPLTSGLALLHEEATRDAYVKDQRPRCTVLPLALPEWRSVPGGGSLTEEEGCLVLRAQQHARRLYAPLFFDLAPRRWVEKRTWRQLTIAQQLEVQPPEVAAGYRVQVGRQQWLIYRSLAPHANRTLLGQNISQEFVVARFGLDGCLTELIEID